MASALEAWLKANGFSDIFVDHTSIAGGDKWREALKASAGACRVVVCLVTQNWLASLECFSEFGAAWYMGKRIVPLFLLPSEVDLNVDAKSRLARVQAEDQGIDLVRCLDASAVLNIDADQNVTERLRVGLRAAGAMSVGLDPEAFATDTSVRPTPFPGLASFGDEDADAALFYGRSREIAQTLEELRKMRAEGDLRPFVILGASGAGKSSLLKAGIIPRLRRETPAWLPLRAFRPGADPLLNFAGAIAKTLADFGPQEAHGVIRDQLSEAWQRAERNEKGKLTEAGVAALGAVLEGIGAKLRKVAHRIGATILISVDQAEELARADGKNAEILVDYLRASLGVTRGSWQLALTVRTDSFPELQSHSRFQGLEARGYDLRSLSISRFVNVVEAPAKRYGVSVDPALVDALIEDAPKEDVLPLLAFALQRLWQQYAASGTLAKAHYDKVEGLQGLIEDAAERAMRGIEPGDDVPLLVAPPPKRQTDLAAATFVPALVEINDQGATIRHIADWSGFSEERQHLLMCFEHWRLVVRKGGTDGGTVEVAHEALFRTWKRLEDWLEPERARLEALRALQIDAGNWERNGRQEVFLNHRLVRLREARELCQLHSYSHRVSEQEKWYIAECEKFELANEIKDQNIKLKHEAKDRFSSTTPFLVTIFSVFIIWFMKLNVSQNLLHKVNLTIGYQLEELYELANGFIYKGYVLLVVVASLLCYYLFTSLKKTKIMITKRIAEFRTLSQLELLSGHYQNALDITSPKRRSFFNYFLARALNIKASKAHALMFLKNNDNAREIYLKYKGRRFGERKELWDDVVDREFSEFEHRGLCSPLMVEVRRQLNTTQASGKSHPK